MLQLRRLLRPGRGLPKGIRFAVTVAAVHPQAAVAVVVRRPPHEGSAEATYALIQRGNPPNAGMWSLPGGRIELGEETMAARPALPRSWVVFEPPELE